MPRGKKKVEDAVKAIEEKAVATEVAVKKAARSTGRKAKAKVEEAVAQVAEKVDAAAAAAEIEVGKAKAKRTRKAAEAKEALVEAAEAAKKPARKARAAKLDIVFRALWAVRSPRRRSLRRCRRMPFPLTSRWRRTRSTG